MLFIHESPILFPQRTEIVTDQHTAMPQLSGFWGQKNVYRETKLNEVGIIQVNSAYLENVPHSWRPHTLRERIYQNIRPTYI